MIRYRLSIASLLCTLAAVVHGADRPPMYLCLDDSLVHQANNRESSKLVYGYIDGEKTRCMSESELLALFGDYEYRRRAPEREAEMKKMAESMKKGSEPAGYKGAKALRNAQLHGKDLSNLDLAGADLRNADLSSADLRGADLSGADLSGADLSSAYCKGARLAGADLSGAALTGAYFNGADLTDVRGLTIDSLRKAYNLYAVRMDSVTKAEIQKYHPEKFKDPGWRWDTNAWVDGKEESIKKLRNE